MDVRTAINTKIAAQYATSTKSVLNKVAKELEFNGPQDWYKYISGIVIRDLNEVCPAKSGQVMRKFLGVWVFL